jgi:hypothetical protein
MIKNNGFEDTDFKTVFSNAVEHDCAAHAQVAVRISFYLPHQYFDKSLTPVKGWELSMSTTTWRIFVPVVARRYVCIAGEGCRIHKYIH